MENKGNRGYGSDDGHFAERADELGAEAREQLRRVREQASAIGARAVDFIRERPFTSLAIAAAAGYLIGRIAR